MIDQPKRDRVWQALGIPAAKQHGDRYRVRCINYKDHSDSDKTHSLDVRFDDANCKVVLKCFGGCTYEHLVSALGSIGLEQGDLFYEQRNERIKETRKMNSSDYGCTLADLSARVGIDQQFLENELCWSDAEYRLKDIGIISAVRMPLPGDIVRFRVQLSGSDKYRCNGTTLYVYDYEEDYRIAVEGETDFATGYYHGFPMWGISGAANTSVILKEHCEGVKRLFVVQEPGQAGERFVKGIADRLKDLRVSIPIRVVRLRTQNEQHKDINDLNTWCLKYSKNFKNILKRNLKAAKGLRPSKLDPLKFMTAQEIVNCNFPKALPIIEGLMYPGLYQFAGPPKAGKSWLLLQWAIAVATGTIACNTWQANKGKVLYVDTEQLIGDLTKGRIIKLDGKNINGELTLSVGHDLIYIDEWPNFADGGLEEIDIQLELNPDIRLLIFDVGTGLLPKEMPGGNAYDREFPVFQSVDKIGQRRDCAIVWTQHDRKDKSDDPRDNISGSRGRIGAAKSGVGFLYKKAGEIEGQFDSFGNHTPDAVYRAFFDIQRLRWTMEIQE